MASTDTGSTGRITGIVSRAWASLFGSRRQAPALRGWRLAAALGVLSFGGMLSPQVAWATKANTTTTLSSNANPSVAGQQVTLTATVTGSTPTGTVTFKNGSSSIGSASLSGSGNTTTAKLVYTFTTAQTASLTAVYGGNLRNNTSTSSTLTQTVGKASPQIMLSSTPNPSSSGASVTLSASLSNGAAPTGTVNFYDGSTLLNGASVSNGSASLSTSFSTVGSHTLHARYGGDANNNSATSSTVTQTVNSPSPTTTTATASPNPADVGQQVTITATVNGSAPSGNVNFYSDGASLGSASLSWASSSASTATFTTSYPVGAGGNHTITAVYVGDSQNAGSGPATVIETINAPAATVSIASSSNPITVGQPLRLTATLSPASSTGSVSFADGTTNLGTVQVSGGVAVLSTSQLSPGSHSITASYSGDPYNGPASATLTQTVTPPVATVALTTSANPAAYASAWSLAASVTPSSATGTVVFQDGSTILGQARLSGGTATLAAPSMTVGVHNLKAVYSGDNNNSGASSNVVAESISAASSGVTLMSSANPATATQSINFTVGVTPSSATGSITLKDGTTTIGFANLSGGSAVISSFGLSVGQHSLVAYYSGDADWSASQSLPLSQTVNALTTSVSLSAGTNPAPYGQPVVLTARVSGTSPSGSVAFRDGNALLGSASVASGVATLSVNTLAPGVHTLVATYSGDPVNSTSNSQPLSETISAALSNTVLSASANPAAAGQSVTLKAAVTGDSPSGSVTFSDAGSALGTTSVQQGVAVLTVNSLTVGTHSLTASYAGDGNNQTSTSGPLSEVVLPAGSATTTSLTSSTNPSAAGKPVTFTATVVGASPTGSVAFYDGTTDLATVALSGANASYNSAALSLGNHTITATYLGDGNNASSTSGPLNQVVGDGTPAVTLTSSTNPATYGTLVSLTASLTGGTSPTGTVTFADGNAVLGSVPLSGTSAVFKTSSLAVGPHVLTANYGGDASNSPAASTTLTQTVKTVTTSLSLASNLNPASSAALVQFTATVSSGAAASGSISFSDGGQLMATVPVANGVAVYAPGALSAGGHSISASYSGDPNHSPSSANLTETINTSAATTTVALASNTNPSTAALSVTLTATVTGTSPTGAVNFFDGSTLLGTSVLSSGKAYLYPSALTVGTHSLTAVYVGDGTNASSTSAPLAQTVNKAVTSVTLTNTAPSFGTPLTITAHVVNGLNPTGSVAFFDNGTSLGTAPLNGSQAAFTTSTLSAGSHSLTASYSGDDNNQTSVSTSYGILINALATTTSLSLSNSAPKVGDQILLSAAVAGGQGPTGTVTFYNMDAHGFVTTIAVVPLASNGATSTVYQVPSSGTQHITAVYSGDAVNATSSSASTAYTAVATPTSTILSAPATTVYVGQQATVSVTVSGSNLTAGVQIYDGSQLLASPSSLSNGGVSVTLPALPAGTHSITAQYVGDMVNAKSTSSPVTLTVLQQATPTTTMSSSSNPSVYGNTVTFTASVTPSTATGNVYFSYGNTSLGSSPLNNGVATFSTNSLPVGTDFISANYYGDTADAASTAVSVNQVVNAASAGTVVLTAPSATGNVWSGGSSRQLTLVATIEPTSSTYNGTVSFYDGSSYLGGGYVLQGGASGSYATLGIYLSTSGVHNLTAVFTDSSSGQTATSTALPVAVPPPVTTLNYPGSTYYVVGSPRFPLSSVFINGGDPTATGSVTMYDSGQAVATHTLNSGATDFSSEIFALPLGTHSLTFSYSGDANHPPGTSTSPAYQFKVLAQATPGIAIYGTSTVNKDVPVNVSVTLSNVSTAAQGWITVMEGQNVLTMAQVSPNTILSSPLNFYTPSLNLGVLPPGVHQLTATYSGGPYDAAGTSSQFAVSVGNQASTSLALAVPRQTTYPGQTAAIQATVSPSSATGTVQFIGNGALMATQPVVNGVATWATSFTPAQYINLQAVYSGDSAYTSSSMSGAISIAPWPTTTTITVPQSAVLGTQVPILVSVTTQGSALPTGKVTLYDGSLQIAAPLALVNGQASVNWSIEGAGTHAISAQYTGDAVNGQSSGAASIQLTDSGTTSSLGNQTWQFGYDAMGNRSIVIDPNGHITLSYYDAFNRLSTLQLPPVTDSAQPASVGFGYDTRDVLTQVQDPRNLATGYTTDAFGNAVHTSSPDTAGSSASFDSEGRLWTLTDARGKVTTFQYDALNRPQLITYTSGTATQFEYDGGSNPVPSSAGKLTKMTDESGTTVYGYDGFGRVKAKTQTVGGKTFTVQYGWVDSGPAQGKLQTLTYPSGAQVVYGYDTVGRLSAVSVHPVQANGSGTNLSTTLPLLTTISYNGADAPTGWLWSDGTPREIGYDSYGQIASYTLGNPNGTGMAAGVLRTVGRDAAGRIKTYTHTNNGASQPALDENFGYDNLDRLTSAVVGNTTTQYGYDLNGNRTATTIGSTAYANTVSPTSNQLSAQSTGLGSFSVGYDAAGDITSDGVNSYTYSARGRMNGATTPSGGVAYLYNGLNERVSKTGSAVSGGATYYVYDEKGAVLGEYDASGSPVYESVYAGDMLVGAMKQTGQASNATLNTQVYDVYVDQIGGPRMVTRSADQAIVWRWDTAEPFGATPPDQNPSGLGTFAYNQRLPGQVFDAETGLYQNWFREYNPRLGRYQEPDPLGLQGGSFSLYQYVDGNPLNYVDPNGLSWALLGKAAIGAAVETGMQAINNYRKGCDVFDVDNYNWWMVGISAATSMVAPGWFSIGKEAPGSIGAIRNLAGQLGRAQTASRAAKIEGRILENVKGLTDPLAVQGTFQGLKVLGKKITSTDGGNCTCSH
jgi:RHS repeat-associated protein